MMTGLMTRRAPVAAVGVAALIGALAVGVSPANAAPVPLVVTSDADAGPGSLRDAIIFAQEDPGADTITFDTSSWPDNTIQLASQLPEIGTETTIDASGTDVTIRGLQAGFDSQRAFYVNASGRLTVIHLTLTGSRVANDFGGAIRNFGYLEVVQSTFTGNRAEDGTSGGGAIATNEGTTVVRDSTFANNEGGIAGDDIRQIAGSLTVNNSTFVGNGSGYTSVRVGGGSTTITHSTFNSDFPVSNLYLTSNGQITLSNTILSAGCVITGSGGAIVDGGFNIDAGTGCGFSVANGSQSGVDPMLDPAGLGDNGGPTLTVELAPGSPAIDAGTVAGLPQDQRGMPRPSDASTVPNVPGGDGSDIGAVETDVVVAPTISGTPGVAAVGVPYEFTFTVTGDPVPTVIVSEGVVPPGLSLSSTGVLSGTPTEHGPFAPFTVTATNSAGSAGVEVTLVVNAAPGPVTIDSVTGGVGQITTSFTPGDPGFPADVVYTVIATPTSGPAVVSDQSPGSPVVITGLANGTYEVSVVASNSAGASQEVFWPIAVIVGPVYTFSGFFSPVDNPPVVNTAKAGSALPIKFSLGGDYGLNIFTSTGPTFTTGSCTGGSEDPVTVVAASNSGLSYNATSGVYTYTWKTAKDLAGKCGSLSLNLNDGSTHTVLVKFK